MFNELLKGMGLSIKVDPDDLKDADGTKSIPFKILATEPATAHDTANKDQQGSNFHITAKDFDAALHATIPAHNREVPAHVMLMSNMYAIIVAEELKQQLFSEHNEICISPWDFAQKLWECCYNVPNELTKMSPVDFGMIDGALNAGARSVVLLSDMIPVLFGHSSNKGGNNNE